MSHSETIPATRYPGRRNLILGICFALVGFAMAFAQLTYFAVLKTPWYMPIFATVGTLCVLTALWQRRSIGRWIAFVLVAALTGFEWFAMLVMMATPVYAGPVEVGQPFPAFATMESDGSPFTQSHFKSDKNSILIFFRGRW